MQSRLRYNGRHPLYTSRHLGLNALGPGLSQLQTPETSPTNRDRSGGGYNRPRPPP
ncbi:hypothetical protein BGW80DRAFT_1349141 [Lactifluus volemus]|nr:hypothetical protein BGW80DRAFT_1349141 [Lactifluus volemus]